MYTKQNKPMFLYLLALTILCTMGFQTWRTLLNNYAVDIVGITGQQMGVIQGLREVPGFLALLVVYLLLLVKEHRLIAISLAAMGVGVALTGLLPSYYGIIATTLLMSFGFHYYETLNQSLTLQYFDTRQAPLVFGRLRSLGAATNIAVGCGIFLCTYVLEYSNIFLAVGLFVILGALACLFYDPSHTKVPKQRTNMVFRSRYWLFYALSLMAGARRQIFVAFAVFLLVQKFQFTIREITILFVFNNLINYFLTPLIGKAINRFGERKVLSLEYLSLFVIFLVYAYTDSKIVVAAAYVLDHIFFNFAMAIRTYFQKIADPKDIAPSMAVSFTINHVAAVAIPILGGLVWMVDYKIPFLAGAFFCLISLGLVQYIRTPGPTKE